MAETGYSKALQRTFLHEKEELYFFPEQKGKPFCFLYQSSHFCYLKLQIWSAISPQFMLSQEFLRGTELCKNKVNTLKLQSEKQTQFFQRFKNPSERVTLASYQVVWTVHTFSLLGLKREQRTLCNTPWKSAANFEDHIPPQPIRCWIILFESPFNSRWSSVSGRGDWTFWGR